MSHDRLVLMDEIVAPEELLIELGVSQDDVRKGLLALVHPPGTQLAELV